MKTHQFTKRSLEDEVARLEAILETAEDFEEFNLTLAEREAFQDAIETGYAFHRDYGKIALGTFDATFDENGDRIL